MRTETVLVKDNGPSLIRTVGIPSFSARCVVSTVRCPLLSENWIQAGSTHLLSSCSLVVLNHAYTLHQTHAQWLLISTYQSEITPFSYFSRNVIRAYKILSQFFQEPIQFYQYKWDFNRNVTRAYEVMSQFFQQPAELFWVFYTIMIIVNYSFESALTNLIITRKGPGNHAWPSPRTSRTALMGQQAPLQPTSPVWTPCSE